MSSARPPFIVELDRSLSLSRVPGAVGRAPWPSRQSILEVAQLRIG